MLLFSLTLVMGSSVVQAGSHVYVVGCRGEIAASFLKRDPRTIEAHVGDPVRLFLEGKWQSGKIADFPENEHHIDVHLEDGRYGRVDLLSHRHYLDLRPAGVDLPDPRTFDSMLGKKIEYTDPGRQGADPVRAYVVAVDLENGRYILRRELRTEEAIALGVPRRPDLEFTIESRIAPLHSIPMGLKHRILVDPELN